MLSSRLVNSVSIILGIVVSLFSLTEHANAQTEAPLIFQLPYPDYGLMQLITDDDIARPNSYWIQFGVGGSFYDARRNELVGRWSPGVQVGRRFGRAGIFLNLELDQSFDLNQEVKKLNVIHIGPGFEALLLLGRIRTSVSAGLALLASDTDVEEGWNKGWSVDIRPLSVRWGVGNQGTVEFTPLSVDASVPVTSGIPLILFSYMTLLSFECAQEAL